MGEITETEKSVLSKFKEKLEDLNLEDNVYLTDMQLIRWLRARDMNLGAAEQMLRNTLKWRNENSIEEDLKRPISEAMRAEFPFEEIGSDKQGNCLIYIPFGKMDIKRGFRKYGKDVSYGMRNCYVEGAFQILLQRSKGDNCMKRIAAIIDFKGLSYLQLASMEIIEYLLSSVQIFEQNYPEIFGIGFMVNTPAAWSILWTMARPLLHQRTVDKVNILGSDPDKIFQVLSKYIDKECIPEKYGGTKKVKYPEPIILPDEEEQKVGPGAPGKSFLEIFGNNSINNNC